GEDRGLGAPPALPRPGPARAQAREVVSAHPTQTAVLVRLPARNGSREGNDSVYGPSGSHTKRTVCPGTCSTTRSLTKRVPPFGTPNAALPISSTTAR